MTTVWLALNSILIVLLTAVLIVTLRQVGILLNQLAPVGARQSSQGPRIGENIAAHIEAEIPGAAPRRLPGLYIFASESCAVCGAVRQAAERLSQYWSSRAMIHLIYDEPTARDSDATGLSGLAVWRAPRLRERLDVKIVPIAVMTDGLGQVLSKGLVNDISQIESLLESARPQDASRAADPVVSRQEEEVSPRALSARRR